MRQPSLGHDITTTDAEKCKVYLQHSRINEVWIYERESILEDKGFDAALYRKGLVGLMDEHRGSLSLVHRILVIALSLKDEFLAKECYRRARGKYHPSYWTDSADYLGHRRLVGMNP